MRTAYKLVALCIVSSVVFIAAFVHEKKNELKSGVINGERPLVIIIPSYKNEQWCMRNIQSILMQDYNNYRVVYIDDFSPDQTYARVKGLVDQSGKKDRFTLIKNQERRGALYNLYHAIHVCKDYEIVLTLDGDDWLSKPTVLQTINAAYDDPNVWLTYGQFQEYPKGHLGICHPMPEAIVAAHNYRSQPWFTSHLRTFYAGLFKRVKEHDLRDEEGNFYAVTWDQAFMFPMLEMANGKIKFIDDILYIYNQANPLNDYKQHLRRQLYCERMIRGKQPYQPLQEGIVT